MTKDIFFGEYDPYYVPGDEDSSATPPVTNDIDYTLLSLGCNCVDYCLNVSLYIDNMASSFGEGYIPENVRPCQYYGDDTCALVNET